ncbi:DUF1134 domain-containing protein [Sphingomonas sp.]|uniref:DUF1134 domain-containing protein n=1 Tax=Sphingomonas sp. TaxID=28214 RepID=UPI002CC0D617|nr:DUF1134 domain-containing protein [Sphingomonas sp.]HWK36637.1 DUF1134 domain-containing protein [Sphingomonas sp.]
MRVSKALGLFFLTAAMLAAPASSQVRTVDPNSAIDSDLRASPGAGQQAPVQSQENLPVDPGPDGTVQSAAVPVSGDLPPPVRPTRGQDVATYEDEDVIAAAEGVFGKGAQGLASMVENLLKSQGRPNAYIAGREAGGALVVGLRYGSGTMSHKVEGDRKVFWTGPSVGFDVGGDAAKVFVLVYNLYDSQDLYKRFPAAEGRVYFVGGFAATYLRRGDIVLIPIRLGVGWRLGANVGYMKFSEKSRWLPF